MPDISFFISLLKLNREHSHSCYHLSFCWVEKCKSFSYKTFLLLQSSFLPVFFFFCIDVLKFKFLSLWRTLGKLWDSKMHHKTMQNVRKSRAQGWNRICTCKGKLKRTREVPASCSPRLPVVPCPAWGSIHFNYEEMLSEARQGLRRGSPYFR